MEESVKELKDFKELLGIVGIDDLSNKTYIGKSTLSIEISV